MHAVAKGLAALALGCAAMVLIGGTPAYADGTGTAYLDGDGVTAEVNRHDGTTASRSSGPASEEVCTVEAINTMREGFFYVDDNGRIKRLYDETHKEDEGKWMRRTCIRQRMITSERMYWAPNADPAALAQQALDHAPLPNPVISISAELPAITLTGYPQWLWIDPAAWRTVTASASLGGLTSTVIAAPARVTWDSGDKRASTSERYVNCAGPGKPLPANAGYEERVRGSDCTYRYLHTSGHEPDLAFDLSATIVWNVTWTTTDGSNGSLGPVSRTASIPVKVGKNQRSCDETRRVACCR